MRGKPAHPRPGSRRWPASAAETHAAGIRPPPLPALVMRGLALATVLVASPAAADNYTSRSSRQASVSVDEPVRPESSGSAQGRSVEERTEFPPVPFPPAPRSDAEPILFPPPPAEPLVPGTDSSRSVPGTDPDSPESAPIESAPIESAPVTVPPIEPTPSEKPEKLWIGSELLEEAHSHPSAKGLQSHTLTTERPTPMPGNGMIVQKIWLDPQDPPQGIAMRFELTTGEEIGVYWEGEREVFTPTEYEELWYYGMLPELGKWVRLEILAEDLGLEDAQVAGVTFSTFGGRALWGPTMIAEAPPLEGESAGTAPTGPPSLLPE